jgi:2-polyprenyl-3-methyl-5-hydroxy-6-metoxy-1,4-benzoquinol methylase
MNLAVNLNTPEYWDEVYRFEWDSGQVHSVKYRRDYRPIHEAIINLISDGSRVLDIGCGPGLLCRKIKLRLPAAQVMGVDFSQYTVSQNQRRDASLCIEYRRVDIRTSLAELGGLFDVVLMCEVLEHLDEPEQVVAAAFGLLKPGGRFILTCPHDNEIPDPEHVRIWGHDQLFHLLAPYGETISFMHFASEYYRAWMLAYLTKAESHEAP